ncbi:aminohydrolase [Gracilibacillus halophilus YIM-C55.5]|uniref:Aminohydrolase n=1 Tax=Gracilibacillus halophilus YIM-C55.5 TaxID=1308866 RepID=N4WFE1_9BACI|nr:arginine deiminase family protein [Gracilibacillus halophilus]ENH97989.1 aminohydrolase [Gracilibacillus halophilus YIM-C55.5]
MIHQKNEFAKLKRVIVCPPTYMKIKQVINQTQRYYKDENIDVEIAMKEHRAFSDTLRQQGVEVIELPADETLNEQVFTRDIGVTIDDQIYTAKMGKKLRKPEVSILENLLQQYDWSHHPINTPSIEGGDVIVAGDIIWIGISTRTTYEAVDQLQHLLPQKTVIPIPLREDILHLDCAFNLVSEKEGLIYPDAFGEKELEKLQSRYELIEVSDDEQFTLGTNVFSIGENKIISLPKNQKVNAALQDRGYHVIEVDFSEIIKSGGSFRCCTLPIERESFHEHI